MVVKLRKIIIRCDEDLYRRWRMFVAENDFKYYSEALDYLLSLRRTPRIEKY